MKLFRKKTELYETEYETERLFLRVFKPECSKISLDYYYRNKDFLAEWDPSRDAYFYSRIGQLDQLRYEFNEYKKNSFVRFWIFKKDDNKKTIGNLCFSNIIYGNFKSCFLGYKLDKDEINNGYMTEAIKKGIQIMFDEYKLHRIEVNIIPRNLRSLKVAKKLNLEEEGFSKRYLLINDVWEDHYHFAAYNDKL